MKTIFSLTLAASLIMLTGCTAVHDSMRISEKNSHWNPIEALSQKKKNKSDEEVRPEAMAAIWKDSVYSEPGKPTMRGFGGRIFFYDAENNAVRADGELVVYGFDNDINDSTRPQKKFVFKQDVFQKHFSESALGGSYSVWIPWDKFGGYNKSITLIPVFKTADNRVLKTGQSLNVLPGKEVEFNQADSNNAFRFLGSSSAVVGGRKRTRKSTKDGVTRASYDESGDERGESAPQDLNVVKLRVSSIPLTKNLQQLVESAQDKPPSNEPVPQASEMSQAPEQPVSQRGQRNRETNGSDIRAIKEAQLRFQTRMAENANSLTAGLTSTPTSTPTSASNPQQLQPDEKPITALEAVRNARAAASIGSVSSAKYGGSVYGAPGPLKR